MWHLPATVKFLTSETFSHIQAFLPPQVLFFASILFYFLLSLFCPINESRVYNILPNTISCKCHVIKKKLQLRLFSSYLEYPSKTQTHHTKDHNNTHLWGHLGGSSVELLPLSQGVILEFWDRVPHQASCMESASSLCLCLSLSLSLSLMNKYIKSLKKGSLGGSAVQHRLQPRM